MSQPKSIIVADDEAGIRLLAARALRAQGHTVHEAKNGNEVIKTLETDPVDVLVTDIIMPDREGIETIVEVRRRWPNVRVIAISGGGRVPPKEFLELAAVLGAHLTITKPFSMTELVSAVAGG